MNRRFLQNISMLALGLACLAGCRRQPAPTVDDPNREWTAFNARSAFDDVANLAGFGSRAHESTGHRHAANYIRARLKSLELDVSFQLFTNQTPTGVAVFRNIEAILPGNDPRLLLVTTHYDSLHKAPSNFQAANSAGSGPAVLLEIARILKAEYRGDGPEIRLVFFDGQEPLGRHIPGDGLRGSKFYARELRAGPRYRDVIAVINLDMVGDRDLTLTLPRNISIPLRQKLLDAAHREDLRTYISLFPAEIGDDHDPFHQLKMPAINLIDYQYGSAPGRNDYWRTDEDTIDKISPDSLEITGRVTLRLIRDLFSDRRPGP